MKRLLEIVLLSSFVFSFFSCADAINKKMNFTPPAIIEPEDSPEGGNNGIINFEGNGDWHWHYFTDEEFCVEDHLTNYLSYKNDCIEFIIDGIPTQDVNVLILQLCNVDGNIGECSILSNFHANESFSKIVTVPLSADYDPSKDTWLNLCYSTDSVFNNSNGLEIRNFHISAHSVTGTGFVFSKATWGSDFSNYNYSHVIQTSALLPSSSDIVSNYCNIVLDCDCSNSVSDFYLIMSGDNIYESYRICDLKVGNNYKTASFLTNIPSGSKLNKYTLMYNKDLDYAITMTMKNIQITFSTTPTYTVINTD